MYFLAQIVAYVDTRRYTWFLGSGEVFFGPSSKKNQVTENSPYDLPYKFSSAEFQECMAKVNFAQGNNWFWATSVFLKFRHINRAP